MVGVELETEITDSPIDVTDGTYNGHRLFSCQGGKGLFVNSNQCSKDRRFGDCDEPSTSDAAVHDNAWHMFGDIDCPIVTGEVAPLSKKLTGYYTLFFNFFFSIFQKLWT